MPVEGTPSFAPEENVNDGRVETKYSLKSITHENDLMSFTITCPACDKQLRVPESLLGQAVKCPACAHNFTAPDQVDEEAPRRSSAPERPSRRPATPPPEDDFQDEPRPSRRRPRDDDEGDDDEAPRRSRRRSEEKPGKIQGIAIMILVGGVFATLTSLGILLYIGAIGLATLGIGLLCCLWPGPYYGMVVGIMAIIKGAKLLGEKAHREAPPQGIAIMMIIDVINGDMIGMVLGIVVLVFLSDEEVKDYFRG